MISFPTSPDEALAAHKQHKGASYRAGATDLTERRKLGRSAGPLVDLRDVAGIDTIDISPEGGLRIGAMVRLDAIADDPRVQQAYPALAYAAGHLATPQIRAQATLGGNLLQDVRCWYYRTDQQFQCLKAGGSACLARQGDHVFHSVVDLGACIAPHPSTMAVALIAFAARATVIGGKADRFIDELLGDGKDPMRTHSLEDGALLTHVVLPPPVVGARSVYLRTSQRSHAEWPLAEVVVHLSLDEDKDIAEGARVVVGGIANRPVRMSAVEASLVGKKLDKGISAVAEQINKRSSPRPAVAYKIPLLATTVADILQAAVSAVGAQALSAPPPEPAPGAAQPGDQP